MSGVATYQGPSWTAQSRTPQTPGGRDNGLPPGVSQLKHIDLPGELDFGPRVVCGQLLVGLRDAKELMVAYDSEGELDWSIGQKTYSGYVDKVAVERVQDVIETGSEMFIYSHYGDTNWKDGRQGRSYGFARRVNLLGEVKSTSVENLRTTLRFQQHDQKRGGFYFINEEGGIGRLGENDLTESETIGVLKGKPSTKNIFLWDGSRFFLQVSQDTEDLLYAYRPQPVQEKLLFGQGLGLRFADAFLGDSCGVENDEFKGMLFLSAIDSRNRAFLFALEIATGRMFKKVPLRHVSGRTRLQPAEYDILAVNPERGAISAIQCQYQYPLEEKGRPFPSGFSGSGGFSHPTLLGNTIWAMVTCRDGYAYIFKRGADGSLLGRIQTHLTHPYPAVYLGNFSGRDRFAIATADAESDSTRRITLYELDAGRT